MQLAKCPLCDGEVDLTSIYRNQKGVTLNLKCLRCKTTFRVDEEVWQGRLYIKLLLKRLKKEVENG